MPVVSEAAKDGAALVRIPKPKRAMKGKAKPKRKTSRKSLRAKADTLFSLMIRERDGNECCVCGSFKQMTCGHLVSRKYSATRWDPQNAVAQCWGCNCKAKFDELWWEAWIEERFPGRLAQLKVRARQGVAKVDLEAVVESLKEG